MTSFWKFWSLFFVAELWKWNTKDVSAADVCYGSFRDYLKCLSDDANNRIQLFEEDATVAVQEKIKLCFSRRNCALPNFSGITLDRFLVEPWLGRIKTILDLLESTHPRVQQCMVQFFNGIAQRKIEACVRQYGDGDVKNFEMPPLPDLKSLDITKLKTAVLNRMEVTQQMIECSRMVSSDDLLQESIDCVKVARMSTKSSVCSARDNCMKTKITDQYCSARFGKVQQGACNCFEAENQRFKSGGMNLDNWKELKESLFQGGMEREYKKCHERNNLPYPQDKVTAVKQAVGQIVVDVFLKTGLPDRVRLTMRLLAESMRELNGGGGRRLFCEACAAGGGRGRNVLSEGSGEAAELRRLGQSQGQQGLGQGLGQGQSQGFFQQSAGGSPRMASPFQFQPSVPQFPRQTNDNPFNLAPAARLNRPATSDNTGFFDRFRQFFGTGQPTAGGRKR